jgi:hypothetical protein
MNPEPMPSTSSLACRRRFPTIDLFHRRKPTTMRLSTAYAPNRDPHLEGSLPGTSFPATHRRSVGELRAGEEWRELPYFVPGRKVQLGQAAFTGWAKHHRGRSPLQ